MLLYPQLTAKTEWAHNFCLVHSASYHNIFIHVWHSNNCLRVIRIPDTHILFLEYDINVKEALVRECDVR